jgi:hypothetical protein
MVGGQTTNAKGRKPSQEADGWTVKNAKKKSGTIDDRSLREI